MSYKNCVELFAEANFLLSKHDDLELGTGACGVVLDILNAGHYVLQVSNVAINEEDHTSSLNQTTMSRPADEGADDHTASIAVSETLSGYWIHS